ncbi:hypothetical protein [Kineosporia babensis]|uniref:Uncharacterized protein n=1 Tax=Kineosporia babensis TaxID=499548 RepID=A0A9X1SYL7_9ACTN|nr:hypothetical protein [Kineosporia babensis]MCD5317064.1 hypothetical protein [Kineosporia babensis]
MNGYEIKIDGTSVTYLPPGAEPADSANIYGRERLRLIDDMDPARTRQVIEHWHRPMPSIVAHLFWTDDTDLEQLDLKVAAGQVTDRDFFGAIPVERMDIKCRRCGTHIDLLKWQLTNPLLKSDFIERDKRQNYLKECPHCGNDIHAKAVYVFSWTPPEDGGTVRGSV